jgi:hypothetical protein
MQPREGFEATRTLLEARGFTVSESEVDSAFGSWLIVVEAPPRLRVLWDGKDQWAIVQGEVAGRSDSSDWQRWKDLWIGKRPEDWEATEIVKAVERLRDFAADARAPAAPD